MLNTNSQNSRIEATAEIVGIIEDLYKLQELKRILFDKETDLKDKVTNYMGLHTTLTANGKYLVLWENCRRNIFDFNSFRTAYPELYSLFLTTASSRIFKLNNL